MRRSGAPIIDVASEGGVGLLPTVASHQANHGGSSSSTKKHRRASSRGSKPFQWFFRVSVGMCLLTVLTMYVMMTWHVVLLSSTTTGGNEIGIQSEALWSSHRRILYEPVLFFNVGRVDADTGKDLNRKINHGLDDSSHSLPKKPLVVGYYFSDSGPTSFLGLERLDPYLMRSYDTVNTRIRRQLMTKQERKRQEALEDSEDYADNAADTMQDQGKDCVAQYDWQESSFPACNLLMEEDMTHLLPHLSSLEGNHGIRDGANVAPPTLLSPSLASSTEVRMISHGYWRDVWSIETNKNGSKDFSETYVLKTMRYTHDYVQRNYDRHRRDAVAMERLTASPFVMNIYAACGNSGLFEYADGGSLEDSIWNEEHDTPPWSSQERLVVAYQAAAGLADLHNVGKEGVPSIAHTDISHGQFVYVNDVGVYKLNDFNRARFIGWNKKTDTPCSFRVGNNPGKFRSPEEYKYERETEKVDVYSLGNIFYGILCKLWPFEGVKDDETIRRTIMNGSRPPMIPSILNSTDPFDLVMLKAIDMCWVQDPKERASAREVQKYIDGELKRLGVQESAKKKDT